MPKRVKYRFEFTRRKSPKAVLRQVKKILSDPQNFTQNAMRRYKDGEVVRVCTLGAIDAVAVDEKSRIMAKMLLRDGLSELGLPRRIPSVNDGHFVDSGRGQKERARQQILTSIDKALSA